MNDIVTKADLIAMLENSNQWVRRWFTEFPTEHFFIRRGEAWSASDNVDHLIRAHTPVARALKLPKFLLRALFGRPAKTSMSYEALCQLYREAIARGAQASEPYLPQQDDPATYGEGKKKQLLDQFAKASAALVSVAELWNEKELDEYLLPHPILGKLTIREMLFFTIYHNLRHASREGD